MNNPQNWFVSRYITAHLKEVLDRDIKPTSYLRLLVMDGYIKRAYKPKHLIRSKNGQNEYIYRWSGKIYRDNIERILSKPESEITINEKAILASCLKAHYPNLPKEFRSMML